MLAYLDLKTDKYRVLVPNRDYLARYNNIIGRLTYLGCNMARFDYGSMLSTIINIAPTYSNKTPEIHLAEYESVKHIKARNYISKEYKIIPIKTKKGELKTQRRYVGEKFDYEKYQEDLQREFKNAKWKSNIRAIAGFEDVENVVMDILANEGLPFSVALEKFEVEVDTYIDHMLEEEIYKVFTRYWDNRIAQHKERLKQAKKDGK